MTSALAQDSWESLLHAWTELDLPEGWRAEIIDGGIAMTPPPANMHNRIGGLIHRALARALPDDLEIHQTQGIRIAALDDLYIPDVVVVAPRAALPAGTEPISAEKVLLVVEITSRRGAGRDRNTKKWGYAHGPVPLYLLIDRFDENGPSITLYSEPEAGHYRRHIQVPFGESVPLPAPFGIELSTGEFPAGE
ncbi:MAG TPA: Uma2 family endonuclease [Mycobacteriales bacterium]|nr:Uma2 family endonuclease [Mycobacteriales bacterium]